MPSTSRFVAAPWFADVAEGRTPRAVWLNTADGVRLRAAIWPEGARGTVILLPGRTEYVEKYSAAADDLARRGYATIAVDWRGQGLATRALADPLAGHVVDFDEYQRDLDALIDLAGAEGLPEPWFLISHSMGGCIALRGLLRGLPVQAAVFSAPMWGIAMAGWMRPTAMMLGALAERLGQTHRYVPSTGRKSYVLAAPFAGNVLTTDAQMFDWMRRQVTAHPELALGGPTLAWLRAALRECAALMQMPAPRLPCLTVLGTAERVVDIPPVHLRMAGWPGGRLELYPGAEHEVMMETPPARTRFFDAAAALFDASARPQRPVPETA